MWAHMHRWIHAHTQTEILSIFPSPQQNTSVGNESAAVRRGKVNPEKYFAMQKKQKKQGLTTDLESS